jgi:hypothetical protein
MTNLTEVSNFDAGVYFWQTTDPVQGGTGGVAITPVQNLTNRTRWLYDQVNTLATEIAVLAPINSPNFTGSPTVPNVAAGDNSTKAINSAFIQAVLNGLATVNCTGSSNITLTAAQYGVNILLLSGSIGSAISVIFPAQSGNWVVINTTTGSPVTCKTAGGTGVIVAQATAAGIICDGTNIRASNSDFSRVGNLISSAQALFSNGTFTDPDLGFTRDAKFGQNGIAVHGGTKTDTLNVTGLATAANLNAGTGVFGQRVAFSSTTTWTCPANVYYVKAYVTGGGGGGANSNNGTPGGNYSSGAGGGAGGTAIGVVAVTPGTVYGVTVGAPGVAQGNGGNSIFASLVGFGGNGATFGAASNSAGQPGGFATGGSSNHQGGTGQDGQSGAFTTAGAMGGASFWGGGGRGGASGGELSKNFGGGGGGSYGASGTGGGGGGGLVVLEF